MRLTSILLLAFCLNSYAEGFAQKLTLSEKDVPLEKVFNEIKKQTGYTFIYREKLLQKTKNISISITNATLEQALDICLRDQQLTYTILNKMVVIKEVEVLQTKEQIVAPPALDISGKVSNSKGDGLADVSVIVKGTSQGTSTDKAGQFSISVSNPNSILVFSSIGFATQEVAVNGRSSLQITLSEAATDIQTVIVTALGIKKEAKSLGYATSTVPTEQMTVNRTTNFMNALTGKMAGVNITSMGTGPGGTSKIRIRGQSSFGGTNSPMIVVNGVPIDNTNYGARGDVSARGSNRTSDGGDGLSSIDPDNIESMTVLKGAAASALYGSRAKDGVIMITTKTRGKGTGISVEYNTNYTSDTPLDYTDYQYEYGQGENGVRPNAPNPTSGQWSFGEKFAPGMTQILFDGVVVPYEPQHNQIGQYYQTGNSFTNTISVSSGNEFGGFNLALSNLTSKAILEGSDYARKNIDFGFTQLLAKKVTLSGNISYSNEKRNNAPNIGEQDYSPVVLFSMANSMPMDLLRKYATNSAGDEFLWSRFTNRTNPYFALTRFDHITRDRIFGNITARYDINKSFYIQGRFGQDYYSRSQDYNLPTGSQRQTAPPPGFVNGEYVQDERRYRQINADFLGGFKKKFGDFGVDITAGGNHMYKRLDRNNTLVNDFYQRGLYTLGNGRLLSPIYEVAERKVNSVYGAAEVSYKGFLYLNGTLRNDWFSTLSKANRSILYPSISTSFVFSEAFRNGLPSWITFGKVRFAAAWVGDDNAVPEYSNNIYYAINPQQFPNPSGVGQPLASTTATTVPNADLRPMSVSEKEIGLEMKFLDNRIGFELSYYNKLSTDQIVRVQNSDASGYTSKLINVGESRNKGVEMVLNLTPIASKNFTWNFSFNAAYNESKVLTLGASVSDSTITVGTGDFSGELRQVVGKPIGQLYGYGYLRDENGRQVFDAGNGRPLRTTNQIAFGSAVPVWIGGISNTFNYKGLQLYILVDFKLGNKMISGTNFNAWRHGLMKETLVGRAEGYVIGNGVNPNKQENTTKSGVQAFYETVRSQNIAEEFVYNAGLWQLRQITLGYDFTRMVKSLKFIKGLRLNAVANNVAVIKKWVPNIHPEQFGFPSDNLVGLEATGLPITRSIGFNLNIRF